MSSKIFNEALQQLYKACQAAEPFNSVSTTLQEQDQQFIQRLATLSEQPIVNENFRIEAQQLISLIVANYPHITPFINRDLLWLLGGDCLHFLSEAEIQYYQHVDDIMAENAEITFKQANLIAQSTNKLH